MQDFISAEDFPRVTLSHLQYEDAQWVANGGTLDNRYGMRNAPPCAHVVGSEVFWTPTEMHRTHCYKADSPAQALSWAQAKAKQIGAQANPTCICPLCKGGLK